jgi:hypothetical protein
MNKVLKLQIKEVVSGLFAGGKDPLANYGIDGDKTDRIEKAHPEVAKHIPLSKRVM